MVARDCHDYYGSSATPRRQQRTVRLPQTPRVRRAPPGRFPRSPSTGRQDRRSAVPRGHRRALPQHRTRPRPTEQQTIDQDGPRTETGARAPQTAHSRQFRGCSWVSGLLTLIRLLRLSASLARTARWRQTVVPSSGAAPALRHTSGIRLPLNFSRPLRRPRAGPFTPPGHMAPRGAVLVSRRRGHVVGGISLTPHFCSGSEASRSGSAATRPVSATKQKRWPIAGPSVCLLANG